MIKAQILILMAPVSNLSFPLTIHFPESTTTSIITTMSAPSENPKLLHPGKRICQIIKIKPEKLEEYKELHANVWPNVLAKMTKYHIEDYSIHLIPELNLLVANLKYTGDDWATDSEAMRNDPDNHEWWKVTDALQESLVPGSTGSTDKKGWWRDLEEVFRFDG